MDGSWQSAYNKNAFRSAQTVRREHRSRFKHWLMGTDDWYGASFGSNGARLAGRRPNER